MNLMRSIGVFLIVLGGLIGLAGCTQAPPPYGTERQLALPATHRQAWAVAPVLDLSGQQIDPILQADLVFQQLQTVHGITAIPVNRVVEVYGGLGINKIQTEEQAQLVCELLGCDALLVTSVTAFDPSTHRRWAHRCSCSPAAEVLRGRRRTSMHVSWRDAPLRRRVKRRFRRADRSCRQSVCTTPRTVQCVTRCWNTRGAGMIRSGRFSRKSIS